MFKAIQEQVYSLYKEKRKPLLLAVDEAQYLSTGILNDIKMLIVLFLFFYLSINLPLFHLFTFYDTGNPLLAAFPASFDTLRQNTSLAHCRILHNNKSHRPLF